MILLLMLNLMSLRVDSVAALTLAPPCQRDSFRIIDPLITQVNIVAQERNGKISKKDPRQPLSKLGPKLGLSKEELVQGMTSNGRCYCPGTLHNNPAQANCSLVNSNDQIVTTKHSFVDKVWPGS